MVFAKDNLSINAMGGTELMKTQLESWLDPRLLEAVSKPVAKAAIASGVNRITPEYKNHVTDEV